MLFLKTYLTILMIWFLHIFQIMIVQFCPLLCCGFIFIWYSSAARGFWNLSPFFLVSYSSLGGFISCLVTVGLVELSCLLRLPLTYEFIAFPVVLVIVCILCFGLSLNNSILKGA
ncbi:hypothetical protein PVK06_014898 [Gossypium arboreum]|uniref:Uncharacterized protein n=1 Tax=Gossypium arboreum TaxID=29729 RepID=A0ABR0PVQ0_GOSAR|nr:hypothetical protein PVK06_014898 [Gossypium arboreum]